MREQSPLDPNSVRAEDFDGLAHTFGREQSAESETALQDAPQCRIATPPIIAGGQFRTKQPFFRLALNSLLPSSLTQRCPVISSSVFRLATLIIACNLHLVGPIEASGAVPQRVSWHCADGLVSVRAPSKDAAGMVCQQAEFAREFLGSCGITSAAPLSVVVSSSAAQTLGRDKAGSYDPSKARASLMSLATYARKFRPRFGSTPVMARELHASVAVHEIAHGIFHDRSRDLDLPATAHEYVAYVAQLASLPAAIRAGLLAEHGGTHVSDNLFIFSFFLLTADPERFAINAWRHFNHAGNGCAFLHKVVSGQVHFPPLGD